MCVTDGDGILQIFYVPLRQWFPLLGRVPLPGRKTCSKGMDKFSKKKKQTYRQTDRKNKKEKNCVKKNEKHCVT